MPRSNNFQNIIVDDGNLTFTIPADANESNPLDLGGGAFICRFEPIGSGYPSKTISFKSSSTGQSDSYLDLVDEDEDLITIKLCNKATRVSPDYFYGERFIQLYDGTAEATERKYKVTLRPL